MHNSNVAIGGGHTLGDLAGVVRTAVINHDYLVIIRKLWNFGLEAVDHSLDVAFLVMRKQEDRYTR